MQSNVVPEPIPQAFPLPDGPFTSGEALAAGASRWGLSRLVAEHRVRRVLTDVYVRWDEPDTMLTRARAAAVVLPPQAVAVNRTAAWLWGVDTLRPWELDAAPPLEFFVLRGHTRIRREGVCSGQRDLSSRDITSIGGVSLTVPVRTALDLACTLGAYDALAAMDGLARVQGLASADLLRELPRFRRRRGVVQARRLVPIVDGRAESTGESYARLAIHDAELLIPEPQHWVLHRGTPTYRLDLAYPWLKICVEYDGEAYHSSDEQRDADRRRREWLEARGWKVIVVDKHSFRGPALDAWLRELRDAIVERSQR